MIKRIWHDPVWSKVIAYAICSLGAILIGYFVYSKGVKETSRENVTASSNGNQSTSIGENKGHINIYYQPAPPPTKNQKPAHIPDKNIPSMQSDASISKRATEPSTHTPSRERVGEGRNFYDKHNNLHWLNPNIEACTWYDAKESSLKNRTDNQNDWKLPSTAQVKYLMKNEQLVHELGLEKGFYWTNNSDVNTATIFNPHADMYDQSRKGAINYVILVRQHTN